MDADWNGAITRARAHAPFLARALELRQDLAELLAAGEGEAALVLAKRSGGQVQSKAIALRRERLGLALVLAIGDLAGVFPLARVMEELSEFADRALDQAIAAAISKRVSDVDPAGMIGLALGKHGAGELNYSSDIDPILLYDPETLPRRERDEPGEAAQRYARDIVEMLSQNTPEGYVFRVDLRLRPASEVSPLAISLDAAMSHYESSALAWERAAFIRARAASGDIEQGQRFLETIAPFVWRRSLDFGAIEDIRRLTKRIRANQSGPQDVAPGWNLKTGRGGIREVEFFAQTHQLIHGGRAPALRVRGTRAALDALAAAGHVSGDDAHALGEAYDRLRTVEHRLQMVADQQTHSLPGGDALENVARLDGLSGAGALLDELRSVQAEVATRFDALIDDDDPKGQSATQAGGIAAQCEALGYAEPERVARRIEQWRDGRFRSLRSEAALSAFDAMLPNLLESFADADEPEQALLRWESVLGNVSSAINLFRLLEARPALFDQLVHILSLAPLLADELSRRPELLDTLIDKSAFDLPGSAENLAGKMRGGDLRNDYEAQLDRIRIVTGETRFALGVQLIEAAHDPLEIAGALSRTAEAALQVASEAAEEEFAKQHGRIAGSEPVVLGLGRLGGGELTHASDLDIIHLFSGSHDEESDGPRPLGATLYFNRLAQRVGAALSVPTAQGALYEVDTRLRPQGAQGPLAVSFDSFEKYQREDAWTWEHMALTRARVLVGSQQSRDRLEGFIAEILGQDRDSSQLKADVLKMRGEMASHKAPGGTLDAKLRRGGLVDLEFLVHFLQLRDKVGLSNDLDAALAALADAGLVDQDLAEANRLLTRVLISCRLLAPELEIPSPAAGRVLASACKLESAAQLVEEFDAARQCVARNWHRTFDEELETGT
ncbi:bifunctional [glutamine synthetase] adenylyltransferase/[glutamine synthetase]-adenylyl-L-tyrosine phosphorylase [Altererythrobacter sp. MF3-039]|uniref:bifunctional [glutamine synthetase] adenylyltransferase/[glutamine synthetase]-adenylyl-L-tyrosine phosphorylase n=1 Tax=Altererythrobacter sp. MF3-039 TaxID=3252901 RepID=UPI00390C8C88